MCEVTVLGLDIAKNVFQAHGALACRRSRTACSGVIDALRAGGEDGRPKATDAAT